MTNDGEIAGVEAVRRRTGAPLLRLCAACAADAGYSLTITASQPRRYWTPSTRCDWCGWRLAGPLPREELK